MTDKIQAKDLPHQFLMRKYGISDSQLPPHSLQLKKDLDKTIQLLINRSRGGEIKITPATQSKIESYDRYICDGVFEILENSGQEEKIQKEEKIVEEKREDLSEKIEEINEKAEEIEAENKEPKAEAPKAEAPNAEEPTAEEPKKESDSINVGFWKW